MNHATLRPNELAHVLCCALVVIVLVVGGLACALATHAMMMG
jgi:hypothetical protein